MASLSATTWSARLRCMPPSTLSGEPKSITHGSMPALCRMPTAPSSRVTSHISADIIIGCTMSTGGPGGIAPGRASGGKYRRSRYMATLWMIWNGEGTAPVSRPPYRSTSSPFCAVATSRPTGLVIAERSTTTYSPLRRQSPDCRRSSWHAAALSSRLMTNLINVERATVGYGTRTLLDAVSLGVDEGDAIGVVGRNGDGKTTLLQLLTRTREPDSGRITHTSGLSVGYLRQGDEILGATDRDVARLSGGERRRVALAEVLLGGHDVLVLDEPTNHLDVEVIGWLAALLTTRRAKTLVVVSHDRWFLDAVCTRTWEVHDGVVDGYDGGYASWVLARAERDRQAAATQARRLNLMRKELASLRRGPPARTSKPKFRIEAAQALIADEPPPRDGMALKGF